MRKLAVLFLVFWVSVPVFGQNGLNGGKYFLLLKDEKTISVNTFENGIKEVKTYPITEKSLFTTDQKKRVAILDTAKNTILLYDIETFAGLRLFIPFNIKPLSILLNDDNLFIGGTGKEILIQYHIQTNQWYSLEFPKETQKWKRAVDDLLVNDSLLIAIDNVLLPKYILFNHLKSTDKLVFSHFKELKLNAGSEYIHQGRITSNYLGLISISYSGYMPPFEHIAIYEDLDLIKSFAISSMVRRENDNHIFVFNDFCLIKDKLVIAHKEKGLGIFEIENSYFESDKKKKEIKMTRSIFLSIPK